MSPDRICEYCGKIRETGSTFCAFCGAQTSIPDPAKDPSPFDIPEMPWIWEPRCFPYNGLIVWSFCPRDGWRHEQWQWEFYAGDRLLESISVDREVIAKFVPEAISPMSLVWELFEVAHGKEEVARLVALNGHIQGTTFEIRRVPTDKETWVQSLRYGDLLDAFRKKEE